MTAETGTLAMATTIGRTAKILLAAGFAALVAACAGGGGTPTAIFDLSSTATPAEGRSRQQTQLLIPEPWALKAYNTDSIAVRASPLEISYFAKVLWADRLPRLVQSKVLQSFENSGRVRAAGLPGEGLVINYQVLLEIRAFELRTDGSRRGYVEIAAKLLDDTNGRVVRNEVFTAESPASSDQPEAAVAALDRALKQVLDALVKWTLASI